MRRLGARATATPTLSGTAQDGQRHHFAPTERQPTGTLMIITRRDPAALAGDPAAIARLLEEARGLRRAVRHLTNGNRQMEHAAEMVARMNFDHPEDAVRHMRQSHFRGLYPASLQLCEVEQALAVKKHNPFVVLMTYAVVAPVIARPPSAPAPSRSSPGRCWTISAWRAKVARARKSFPTCRPR